MRAYLSIAGILSLCSAVLAAPKEIARQCLKGDCAALEIVNGKVLFKGDPFFKKPRVVGRYVLSAQRWVPAAEAPIRYQRSDRGWSVVVSASLPEYDPIGPTLQVRVFNRGGRLSDAYEGNYVLDDLQIGGFFGPSSEILAVETSGAHAYVVETVIWLLPDSGSSKRLLTVDGAIRAFRRGTSERPAGVLIDVETYDGINANTKGRRREFWRWDPTQLRLLPPPGAGDGGAPQLDKRGGR